jgi:hypothetical protein
MIPERVIRIRRNHCRGRCDVDPTDPCAICPNGHWGAYTTIGCNGSTPIRDSLSPRPSTPPASSLRRPGDLFSIVIKKITGQTAGNCGCCAARIQTMNAWGWWRCWRERKLIALWLAEEARRRGHEIDETKALDFLRAAWKELRKPLPSKSASTTN